MIKLKYKQINTNNKKMGRNADIKHQLNSLQCDINKIIYLILNIKDEITNYQDIIHVLSNLTNKVNIVRQSTNYIHIMKPHSHAHTANTANKSHNTHTHTYHYNQTHRRDDLWDAAADRESYIATVTRTGIFNQIERSFRDVLLFLKKGVSTIQSNSVKQEIHTNSIITRTEHLNKCQSTIT